MDNTTAANSETQRPFALLTAWVRAHLYTVIATVFFLALSVQFYHHHVSEWDDCFVRAAGNMWHGRDMFQGKDGYLYPPFMAWLSIPFYFMSHFWERMLFYGINVICAVFLCRWAWTLSGGKRLEGAGVSRAEHVIFVLGLACACRYILDAFAHQQVDIIIGFLVMGGCLALSRSRSGVAATAFGLAAAMKCTALLWCPYLLWRRRWFAAAWVVVVAVGVNFLPELVNKDPSGRTWAGEWVARHIMPLKDPKTPPGMWGSAIIFNQSLAGLGNRYFTTRWDWTERAFDVISHPLPMSATTLKFVVYGVEAALFVAALMVFGWLPRREHAHAAESAPSHQALEFSLVLMFMLLLSPMSSKPHFCTLLLPGFCLARHALADKKAVPAILLELAVITGMLSIRDLWGDALSTFALWWGSVTWSTLCLFAGCWYILRTTRAEKKPAETKSQELLRAA